MTRPAPPDSPSDRTLVITLSTVLSAVALFLVVATALACFRVKHGRLPFLPRGTSPIADEEIESWKRRAGDEKFTTAPRHASGESSPRSLRKAPSVIVYHSHGEDSGGEGTRPPSRSRSLSYPHVHTLSTGSAKYSLDLPPPAVLARAPNARPGLTDESVEGDDAFIPTHRRQASRLSKRHARARSSASYQWGPAEPWRGGEEAPRTPPGSGDGEGRGRHARIYSDSSVPPRRSFDEEYGYVAPAVLTGVPSGVPTPESEIGRAIG